MQISPYPQYLNVSLKFKRSFLLLEMMVAMTIALLCIVPLLTSHVRIYQEEVKLLERAQLERWAMLTYLEVSQLVQEDPKFFREKDISHHLEDAAVVYLGEGKALLFERSFQLHRSQKKKEEGFAVVDCSIVFNGNNRVYTYPYGFIVHYEKI